MHQAITVRPEKLHVLSSPAACCLAGDQLFTVPIPAEGLKALADRACPEIPVEDKACFVRDYLAPLARLFPLEGETLECQQYTLPPIPRLSLEDAAGKLTLRFRFAYGEWAYPLTSSTANPVRLEVDVNTSTLYRITRDFTAEAHALQVLDTAGIVPDAFDDRCTCAHGLSLSRLLFDVVPALRAQGFEVVGEETLRTIHVLRGTPVLSLQIATKIDWFDLVECCTSANCSFRCRSCGAGCTDVKGISPVPMAPLPSSRRSGGAACAFCWG